MTAELRCRRPPVDPRTESTVSGRRTRAAVTAVRDPSSPVAFDTAALEALSLSHPQRARRYDLPADDGPATASRPGRAVGETTGTTGARDTDV